MEYLVAPMSGDVDPACFIEVCGPDVDVCIECSDNCNRCDGHCSSNDICNGHMTRVTP